MILPIAKLPVNVLRTPTTNLDFPLKKNINRLVLNMVDTVIAANGVGIAAPQVSQSLNMAIIYLEEMGLPAFPIINPVITKASKETELMEEGCLSMPQVFGMVRRPKKITVEAYNLEGEKFTITDDTFLARVLQHEIDHLNCTLIIDKFEGITAGHNLLSQYQEKGSRISKNL